MLFLRNFEPTGFIKDKPTVYNKIDKLLSDPRLTFDYNGNTDDAEPVILKIHKEIASHTKNLGERQCIEIWALTTYLTNFIDAFTFPFIRGEQNACDRYRKGLMQALEEKIYLFDPKLNLSIIETKAFEIYITKNVQLVDRVLRENFPYAPSHQYLREKLNIALQSTLPIDFPTMMSEISDKVLSKIIDLIIKKHLEEKEIE